MLSSFHSGNRKRLAAQLDGGLIVLSAYGRLQRGNDAAFRFQQESNFWYTTGIDEPDWKVVIDGSAGTEWLVAPEVSETHAIFDGNLILADATKLSGISRVIPHTEYESLLRRLSKNHTVVYTIGKPVHSEYFNFSLNPSIQKNWTSLERQFETVRDCQKELAKLRALKQPEEISAIERAVKCSINAFSSIYSRLPEFKNEREIEAEFEYLIRRSGCNGTAYDSIVASGGNACTLHYVQNSDKLKKHQLVLLDMGASYDHYAADITRTYAITEPSKRQVAVHEAVRMAHERIISHISPGISIEQYQADVDIIMNEALESLGLLKNKHSMRHYFPHAISHGLGIDVHDSLGAPKFFKESMVLTVEPGIYIPEEGIGVRIEDDILVTASGRKNMSARLSTQL